MLFSNWKYIFKQEMSSPSNSEISPLSSPVRASDSLSNGVVNTNIPPLSLSQNSTQPYSTVTDEGPGTTNEHGFTIYSTNSVGTLVLQDEDEAVSDGGVRLFPHAALKDYGSMKSFDAVVHEAPISSSGSSSSSLSTMRMIEPELVKGDDDNVLKKIVDEETPLIGGKQSTSTDEGRDGKPKFLMGISEKEFWFIFTGILIVNFVSRSCARHVTLGFLTIVRI